MAFASLRITNFRNLSAVDLTPLSRGLNVFYGNNGSGKTSLLEAMYYMGLGRSFRGGTANQLIQHQADKFTLFAQLIGESERHIPVGIEREMGGLTRLRVATQSVSGMAEMATHLPLRVINSDAHDILEGGPLFRRQFLDWGLFYQFPAFLSCWRHYERALKQRNALLRDRRPKRELDAWTAELVKYGLELDEFRRQYVTLLIPPMLEAAEALLGITALQVSYHSGWDRTQDYAATLADHYIDESRYGYTQYGPHRADLDLHIEAISVKHFLSRGQQKLLVCAMMLGQGMLLSQQLNKGVIYLVDDLPAELDNTGRQKLLSLLAQQPAQIFITAIEKETFSEFIHGHETVPTKVFHVEHGKLVVTS